jgi:hypothetical protein
MAAWLKDRLDQLIDESYVELLDLLAETRDELRAHGIATEVPGWRRALDAGLHDLVLTGRTDDARTLLRTELARDGAAVAEDHR